MTHSELVGYAAKWVKKNTSCGYVATETKCAGHAEQPDVIGFASGGYSVLVECKVSVADFRRDTYKSFRRREGLGKYRFYAFPEKLWKDDLREDTGYWGVLLFSETGKLTRCINPFSRGGNIWNGGFESDIQHERNLLYSHLLKLSQVRSEAKPPTR
jgi:hypothetical protein